MSPSKVLSLLLLILCSFPVPSLSAPVKTKRCYNLACGQKAAICFYSAESAGSGSPILETTMCLDSAENVLQKATKKRQNILGSVFSTQHVLPFSNENWIGSGDAPETAAEVSLAYESEEK